MAAADGHHLGAKKGTIVTLLVIAIIAIVGVGLFRFLRTRATH